MAIYGYARVSTDGQMLALQKDLLAEAGVESLYAEKVSGIVTKRPELERLLHRLEAGDVLIVTKLGRLARSLRDLLNIVHRIGEAGATFKSLADTWTGTTTPPWQADASRTRWPRRVRAVADLAADQ